SARRAGADLPGAHAAADVSSSVADDAAGSDLRLARFDHPLGLDRPQGDRLFGPSARYRRYRAAGLEQFFGEIEVNKFVMPGLVPGIHVLCCDGPMKAWMAGTSPALTELIT